MPRDLVERIIQAGRYIPSGGNRHAHEFTVLSDGAMRERLLVEFQGFYRRMRRLMRSKITRSVVGLTLGPHERAFLSDPEYYRRFEVLLDRLDLGEDPVFYRAPSVVVIHSKAVIPTPKEDCVLAGYNMVLMAQSLGLGTCFVSLAQNALNSSARCKRIIGLDPSDHVYAVVAMGHPAVRFRRPVPKCERRVRWL